MTPTDPSTAPRLRTLQGTLPRLPETYPFWVRHVGKVPGAPDAPGDADLPPSAPPDLGLAFRDEDDRPTVVWLRGETAACEDVDAFDPENPAVRHVAPADAWTQHRVLALCRAAYLRSTP